MQFLTPLIFLGIFFLSFFSFGYMLNDFFDQWTDKVVGKENAMSTLSRRWQILVLSVSFFIGVFVLAPFYRNQMMLVWLSLSYLFAMLYSAPPFRFKERDLLGVTCASLAQRVFPLLLVYSVLEHFGLDSILFLALSFLIGLRWIFIHQLSDREQDLLANVRTYASNRPVVETRDRMKLVFSVEVGSALMFFGIASFAAPPVLLLAIAYSLYELYLFPIWKERGFGSMLYSYDHAPLADFYFLWMPLGFSIMLGSMNLVFLAAVALEILWKANYLRYDVGLVKLRRSGF
jgi:4-hydroxybenzoate polyprenyltransferase